MHTPTPEATELDPTAPGAPKFQVGHRVRATGVQTGRIQNVSSRKGEFHYLVKWDSGTFTQHAERELSLDDLPTHYP